VDAELKADKVIVFKYKPKKDYRRTQGHRQRYTLVTVQEIVGA
jgi:large subunit ribosomal protein L21